MTLTLEGLTEEEVRLAQAAERRGIRLTPMVKGLLAGLKEVAALESVPEQTPTPQERLAKFRAWVDSHKDVTAVVLDDSRESMYAEERAQ